MNKNFYQLVETTECTFVASGKAQSDIAIVANKMGFSDVYVKSIKGKNNFVNKVGRQIKYIKDFNRVLSEIEVGSSLLIQCPFMHRQINREGTLRNLKHKKRVNIIAIVHDVEELRKLYVCDKQIQYYKREFEVMLEVADIIIVHNSKMMEYFFNKGVAKERLISLEIFDYLIEPTDNDYSNNFPVYEKSIIIAGNLAFNKCEYLKELIKLQKICINLYGPNYKGETSNEIIYHGTYSPNELPAVIRSGFGLVWDGKSLEKCQGNSGNYLRYNNPHKLSLYLAAGIPVFIWRESAEAEFVRKNNLGFEIDSIYDIKPLMENCTEEKYLHMVESVQIVSEKVRTGFYTKQALKTAMNRLI